MDKADFTFIVTALCYLVLSLLCRSGLLDMMVLDVAGVFLCGILMITTLIKTHAQLTHTGRALNLTATILVIAVFLLSIIIPVINPLY